MLASEIVPERWTEERVNAWYAEQPWPVGANFVPSTAINQLEMWQAESFDPDAIDRELGWAASIGMNSMRVFLHDLAYREDPEGFCDRVDEYLAIADRHGVSTLIVFFDGVWNPTPSPGPQPAPRPGVHNSGWVQSPGAELLADPTRYAELKPYVQDVLRRFRDDPRVLGWDLFNEPDNYQGRTFAKALPADEKHDRACDLVLAAFRWAREVHPSQPLTVGVWGDRDWLNNPKRIDTISFENSDVISFHNYQPSPEAQTNIRRIAEHFDRPILCTEYMARGARSTFEGVLPALQENRIGAYNWGLVSGKSQTIYPWHSWSTPFDTEPAEWFHDIFRPNGEPYRQDEAALIKRLTGELNAAPANRPR
ncbi:MAG: cellulase family glycosylhydrolase [Planctomycetota bacterium]